MIDDEENQGATTEAPPSQPRKPRKQKIMLGIAVLLMVLALTGIAVALFSDREDPAEIVLPTHTKESLATEQKPQAAPQNNQAVPAVDPTQDEAPLHLQSPVKNIEEHSEEQQEKPLIREDIAPQSLIDWHRPIIARPVHVAGSPRIVIVIDDMGLNHRNSLRVAQLPAPVTLAYLPYAPNLSKQTGDAFQRGHELIVHMPMEPDNIKSNNPGPDALLSTLSAEENVIRLKKNLAQFDLYMGINNHMGSRMTASVAAMRPVMQELKQRGLWFLDSRTIGNSIAAKVAAETGVPYAERDVFLDNVQTVAAVDSQLRQLEQVAQKRGYAIAIGHPHDATIAALQRWIPAAIEKGFRLVPLSSVIAARFPAATVPRHARSVKAGTQETRHAAAGSVKVTE